MNEEIIINRIAKYKRKIAWNTMRLSINLNTLEEKELSDGEISMIEQRIWEYGARIKIYERKLAYHKKRLAKCQTDIIAP